jgi:hypothetical protein
MAVGDHAMICEHSHGAGEKVSIRRVPAREVGDPEERRFADSDHF